MKMRNGLVALTAGFLLMCVSGGVSAQTPQTMPVNPMEARKAMLAARAARMSQKAPSAPETGVKPDATGGGPGPGPGPIVETVLYNFDNAAPQGAVPSAGVIRDSQGNLYGTAGGGNSACNCGVVFRIDESGNKAVLYTFTGGADGATPSGGLILDQAGNLYGTTSYGGQGGNGVVFKLDRSGSETALYTFTGGADGAQPGGNLLLDKAGDLYGAAGGGGSGYGVVFRLDKSGNETVLYTFTGGADGSSPNGGLVQDSAGNLYGTAPRGGSGSGVVFRLDKSGNETVLYTFTGGGDGWSPNGGLVRDNAGSLYGTAPLGGSSYYGVVFKLDSSGSETVLHSFTGGADGGQPRAGVIRDTAGDLLGTAAYGGSGSGCIYTGCGVVFKINAAGVETVLHSFDYAVDGANPAGSLILDAAGNLYGTASRGPQLGPGTVYELARSGKETVYTFSGAAGGSRPTEAVARDSSGNLYGSTPYGGSGGSGVVYKLDKSGNQTVLHAFTGGADGGVPNDVILDSAGNVYGTTQTGPIYNGGVVFKLDASGNETVLHTFTDGADGGNPYGGALARDTAGDLFGTTAYGGSGSTCCGVVFKVDPYGNETVLYTFAGGGADGYWPNGGIIRDSVGNLYGTTPLGGNSGYGYGVVFKVDKSGNQTVLHTFTFGFPFGVDGVQPEAGVTRDSAGNLYGTTEYGGGSDKGVVFKLDPSGNETALHSFTGGADGSLPVASPTLDPAGNLYGTTPYGGAANCGVVFEVDTSGNFTVLHTFTCGADGANPQANLILDAEGNLYGTAQGGGEHGGGVVFKISRI